MSGQSSDVRGADVEAAGFFVLRTPLLPVEEFVQWGASLDSPRCLSDPSRLQSAIDEDCRRLRDFLSRLVERPEVHEALVVGSPTLVRALETWRCDPGSRSGRRVEHSLVRYFTRMATRPSPFGLFSGWTVGRVGPTTQLRIQGRSTYRRHTQLDSAYLVSLASALAERQDIADRVPYEPNETIYEIAGQIRYAEASRRGPLLRSTRVTPHLLDLLRAATQGATIPELVRALCTSSSSTSEPRAAAFVRRSIRAGLLKSRLEPPVTGPAPLQAFLSACAETVGDCPETDALKSVEAELAALDRQGLSGPSHYQHLAASLPRAAARSGPDRCFKVNLIKPADVVTLGPEVLRELDAAIAMMRRVGVPNADRETYLATFREEFEQRYGTRFVRLVDLFDPDTGLACLADTAGLSPLVHNLPAQPRSQTSGRMGTRRHERLRRRLALAAEAHAPELTIGPADLDPDDDAKLPVPESFHVAVTLAADSQSAYAQGRFRVILQGLSGPPGTRTLGRFCQSDEDLHALVMQASRLEARLRPDAIFAEIAHSPLGPARNVVERPAVHEHEIVYIGRSGVATEQQIPVSDLSVSVSGERITLYSRRLAREVVPRLTSAHVYWAASSPPIYRFLCEIARDRLPVSTFWEADEHRPSYLPRVVCGRTVLSPASWRLDASDLEPLTSSTGAAQFRAVQSLRTKVRWPRHVGFVDGEKIFVVDLDNPLSTSSLVPLLARRPGASMFVEWIPQPGTHGVSGPEGHFAHELLIPFVRRHPEQATALRRFAEASMATSPSCRTLHPGSEWSYIKLYANPSAIDRLLRELVAPLVRSWLADGAADRWFFVRYRDPESHLRLRIRSNSRRLLAAQLDDLRDALASEPLRSLVWKVQCETYERELDRYGGLEGVDVAERLFHADSECALALASTALARDLATRWMLAAKGVDTLLGDLGLSLTEKRAFAATHKDRLWRALKCPPALRRALAARYRSERSALEAVLLDSGSEIDGVMAAFSRRSREVSPLAGELAHLERTGRLTVPRLELYRSYVHMHLNRLMPARNATHELVISDFLHEFYGSQLARLPSRDQDLACGRVSGT